MANVIPIPKVKNPTTPNDYRPIALTSAICKIFEELWKTYKQYGFLSVRNTLDA